MRFVIDHNCVIKAESIYLCTDLSSSKFVKYNKGVFYWSSGESDAFLLIHRSSDGDVKKIGFFFQWRR